MRAAFTLRSGQQIRDHYDNVTWRWTKGEWTTDLQPTNRIFYGFPPQYIEPELTGQDPYFIYVLLSWLENIGRITDLNCTDMPDEDFDTENGQIDY